MIKRLRNDQTVYLFIFIFYLPPSMSFVKNITEFIVNIIKILSKNLQKKKKTEKSKNKLVYLKPE